LFLFCSDDKSILYDIIIIISTTQLREYYKIWYCMSVDISRKQKCNMIDMYIVLIAAYLDISLTILCRALQINYMWQKWWKSRKNLFGLQIWKTLTPCILKYTYVQLCKSDCYIRMNLHARAFYYPAFSCHVAVRLYYVNANVDIISTRETYPMLMLAVISYFYFHCPLYTTSTSVSSNSYYLCLNRQICNMNCGDHKLS